jgi:putative transcriptional regulator
MNTPDPQIKLVGKCLISMPDMPDPRFQSSVIFICAHSAEGAMGLIVNKRVQDVELGDLMNQLSIPKGDTSPDLGADLFCMARITSQNCRQCKRDCSSR